MNDPDCTCPPVTRRIPHNAECPRYDDEDRAWSIEDRLDVVGHDVVDAEGAADVQR